MFRHAATPTAQKMSTARVPLSPVSNILYGNGFTEGGGKSHLGGHAYVVAASRRPSLPQLAVALSRSCRAYLWPCPWPCPCPWPWPRPWPWPGTSRTLIADAHAPCFSVSPPTFRRHPRPRPPPFTAPRPALCFESCVGWGSGVRPYACGRAQRRLPSPGA